MRQRARLDAKTATLDAIKLEKRLELCSEYTRYRGYYPLERCGGFA
ncbi:hypothetical protein NIB75_05735 [Bacteroides uniformis]|nr:hypothetical protein [Bacteroides uniformis]